jgi:DNA invertase Pin-like site-specific DNA recombinase
MQEMLRLIESPSIHGVIARDFSRLMRPDKYGDFILLQAFQETGTVLYLPDGPLDMSTSSGLLMGGMRALMAGHDRREILSRMNGAKEAMRLAGKHAGGSHCLPFGVAYDRQHATWSYTDDAEKIKAAFQMVLTTALPFAQIAERLNLPRTSLRLMLTNPIYTGVRVYGQKRDQSNAGYVPGANGRQGYRRKIERAPEDVIRVRVMDGLVSEDVFNRVQQLIGARVARERTIRTKNAPRYILNGFLSCGRCGNPMYSHTNQKAGYYYCRQNGTRARVKGLGCESAYIMAERIEPRIECVLSDLLQDRALLEDVAASYAMRQEPEVSANGQVAAQRQIKALVSKRERVLESFLDGVISRGDRDTRLKAIEMEIATYSDLMVVPETQPAVTVEGLIALLSVFAEFRFLQREDKRALLRESQARIFVEGYTIKAVEVAAIRTHNDFSNSGSSNIGSHLPAAGA